MNLLTLPARNLLSQKLRSTLTVLGIAVAVGSFVALTGLTRGLQDSYAQGVGDVGGDYVVSQRGTYSLVSSSISEDVVGKLNAVAGVEEAAGIVLSIAEVEDEANIFVTGWPDRSFLWQSLVLEEGVLPQGDREVVLGRTVAEALGKTVGDEVLIQYEPFRISGISVPDSVFNQNLAVARLSSLQALLGRPASVSLVQIRLARPVSPEGAVAVKAALAGVSPMIEVSDSAEFAENMDFVKTVDAITSTVSLVMILASSILVANTLLMSVSERVQEFGILSAIGWTPGRIRLLVVVEGVLMCLIGSVIGVGLGVGAMHLVSWLRISAGLLEPYLSLGIVGEAMFWVVLVGPLAALYPAWRVTRAPPSAALRGIR
ncbi:MULTISPECIES: ABC transporter permease [Alphaproteobacteria]|uniref:ABC transporter permease n=2 Tax=Alphaproteobacteria TaxID=28211 RepID=A0A512HCY0_9HYPH|nr:MULTISPECIES: ABC transporter permease [Alphaproteobacteria]GEO83303.1 ABC transporter permease [Ciceribacter naphthalenivorans]GLR20302.1 ABC transporter permease [Ciceribacter naphthalenivorans]GLT03158.1 ABC transporter permease [Sphingomonas psychrolutea]